MSKQYNVIARQAAAAGMSKRDKFFATVETTCFVFMSRGFTARIALSGTGHLTDWRAA